MRITIDHVTYGRLNNEFKSQPGGVDLSYKKSIEFVVCTNTEDWFLFIE